MAEPPVEAVQGSSRLNSLPKSPRGGMRPVPFAATHSSFPVSGFPSSRLRTGTSVSALKPGPDGIPEEVLQCFRPGISCSPDLRTSWGVLIVSGKAPLRADPVWRVAGNPFGGVRCRCSLSL